MILLHAAGAIVHITDDKSTCALVSFDVLAGHCFFGVNDEYEEVPLHAWRREGEIAEDASGMSLTEAYQGDSQRCCMVDYVGKSDGMQGVVSGRQAATRRLTEARIRLHSAALTSINGMD